MQCSLFGGGNFRRHERVGGGLLQPPEAAHRHDDREAPSRGAERVQDVLDGPDDQAQWNDRAHSEVRLRACVVSE